MPGTYRRNPDFALVNEEGLFQLTENIVKNLMVAVEDLPDPDDPTPLWRAERIN